MFSKLFIASATLVAFSASVAVADAQAGVPRPMQARAWRAVTTPLLLPGTCKAPVVLISDENLLLVNFYEQHGKGTQPCYVMNFHDGLGGIPGGLFVDRRNNLYVGRGRVYDRGEVLRYRPPYTGTPTRVCTTVTGFPWGLAVDDAGTVYAGDYGGYTNLQDEFTRCAHGRSNQIVDPNLDDGSGPGSQFFFTTDAKGNLFDDGWDSNQVLLVDESTDGGVTWTKLQNLGPQRYPGGIEVGRDGNLYINDDGRFGSAGMMDVVPPPYTGNPTQLFSYQTNDTPIALTPGQKRVWSIANQTQGVEYDIATGNVVATTATLSEGIGIATIPSDAP
ncbi:MAG: hypothetical protein JO043_06600 [Candidatus Eremiobacteraeota bacterium]|nr:hypothetical protein [Candidatus Eremiobacteraeota bacterium]